MEKIILITFFSILITILFIYLLYFILKNISFNRKKYIFFSLELDTKRWIIKRNNSLLNNIIYDEKFNWYFKNKIGKGWVGINKLFKILDPIDVEKWKKSIEYCIQNKTNSSINHEIKFKIEGNKKNVSYFFNIKFIYINEEHINIEFRTKENFDKNNLIKKIISKNEILNDKKEYKLFAGFYIEDNENLNVFISFIKEMSNVINIKNFSFFKSNSIIVMYFSNDSYKKITRTRIKLENKLSKSNKKSNINNYYLSCGFVECQSDLYENNFSKIMTRISFVLVKSKVLNKPIYFNQKNIAFNEFEEFKEKIINIHKIIESPQVEYETIPITSLKNKRNIFNLYIPKFSLDDYFWNDYIIKINNFDKKIREKFTSYVLTNNELLMDKKIVISINDYQIEEIFDLMKTRNNILFLINQTKYKKVIEFINLIKILDLSEIKYGLVFDELNSKAISILANVKPQLIVLSEKFNANFNKDNINNKLRLVDAIITTERLGIMLMFINLSSEDKKEVLLLSKYDKLFVNIFDENIFI